MTGVSCTSWKHIASTSACTHGRITEIDGRKVFIDATMTAADGTVLTEANGLMVRLLPHQP